MSKNNRPQTAGSHQVVSAQHASEYQVIRHDLWRVFYLNLLYLAAVLALYFSNRQSGYLERMLGQWLGF